MFVKRDVIVERGQGRNVKPTRGANRLLWLLLAVFEKGWGGCGSIVSGKMLEVVNADVQVWQSEVSSLLFSLREKNAKEKKTLSCGSILKRYRI